uniref:Peptidase S1 domain-containing protein n=1 Tax=Terrapene triunguis TaxID=2587831 RepID=A0A674JNQ6_9SAUR
MAYLDIQCRGKTYIYGRFLVVENFVLTGAHCNGHEISVMLGAHNIREREQRQQKISMCHRIPHPQYNKETTNNDIMLLQVSPPSHHPIPSDLTVMLLGVSPGTMCSITGWGRVTLNPAGPGAVTELCISRNDSLSLSPSVACFVSQGDSGGSLMCGKTAQGIISWRPPTPPGVYRRVSTFIPWIRATMRRLQP